MTYSPPFYSTGQEWPPCHTFKDIDAGALAGAKARFMVTARYSTDEAGRASGCSGSPASASVTVKSPMFVRKCSVLAALNPACVRVRVALRQTWAGPTAALLALALISGCAVGPDFKPPPAPEVTGYTKGRMPRTTAAAGGADGAAQYFAVDRDIPGEWWTLFRSRPLRIL